MEKILISACLVGKNCKYDGKNNQVDWIEHLQKYYDLVPFCPEEEGGLKTPRVPSEIKKGSVINKKGIDVTSYFNKGAEKALNICRFAGITLAILKENSPSCGVYSVYDGTFKGKIVKGSGITTQLLKANGIKVISENEVQSLLDELDYQKQQQEEGRLRNIEEQKAKAAQVETPKEEDKNSFNSKKSYKKFGNKSFSRKDSKSLGEKKYQKSTKFVKKYEKTEEASVQEENTNKTFTKDRKSYSYSKNKSFNKGKRNFDKKKSQGYSNDKSSFHKDGEKSFTKDKKSYSHSKNRPYNKDRKSFHSSFKRKSYSKKNYQ